MVVPTAWFTAALFSEAVGSGNLLHVLGCSLSLWFQTIGIVLATKDVLTISPSYLSMKCESWAAWAE